MPHPDPGSHLRLRRGAATRRRSDARACRRRRRRATFRCVGVDVAGDRRLVAACLADRPGAWEELVARYGPYVLAILRRGFRLADEDAEDLLQDVLLRTYERLEGLEDPDVLKAWLARASRNAAIDLLRRQKRRPVEELDPEMGRPDRALEQLADALTVSEALAAAPEPYREVLDRFFRRDESYETIAEATGLATGTIASRISRGLGHLRRELADARSPTTTAVV